MRWARSVRTRLALWHAVALAAVLSLFALGTYLHLRHNALQRVDASLDETAAIFLDEWTNELVEDEGAPVAALREAIAEFRHPGRGIFVLDGAGRPLAESGVPTAASGEAGDILRSVRFRRALSASTQRSVRRSSIGKEDEGVRIRAARVSLADVPFTLIVTRATAAEHETVDAFLEAVLIAIPLALLLSGIGGYFLARASLAPVAAMAERAQEISAARLDARLPIANPHDELGELGGVLNSLLDRLALALEQQRRFMADASHELRTPVAALLSAADVTLGRPNRSSAEYLDALTVISTEGRRLSRLVKELFLLARADSGEQLIRSEDFYLDEVIAECVRAGRALAAPRGVEVAAECWGEALFRGDETMIRRLVMNLVDNGVKHTPAGGRVSVALSREGEQFKITVTDTGRGVPEDIRETLFQRFVRGDSARGRAAGDGAGLGLAIARWVAEAHGGSLVLETTGASGSRFVATLPLRKNAEDSGKQQVGKADTGHGPFTHRTPFSDGSET